jgi:hypothetical protein
MRWAGVLIAEKHGFLHFFFFLQQMTAAATW